MPSVDKYDNECRRKLLYWAVVEHYRSWLADDGVLRRRLIDSGGKLDAVSVRRIAKIYKVNRGIRGEDGGNDSAATWIAKRLNDEINNWPSGLNDRANRCADLAAEAIAEDHTNGEQASAFTKLMWFLKPDGWTMFDSLASQGIGVRETRAVDRMKAFYQALSERGFDAHVHAIKEVLKGTPFECLFGERVIDKFLILCGSEDDRRREITETGNAFRTLLEPSLDEKLEATARKISEVVVSNFLVHEG